MPLSERDYAREPLPGEEISPEKRKIPVDDLENYELTLTADGYKVEKKQNVQLGWFDVLFWVILILLAHGCS